LFQHVIFEKNSNQPQAIETKDIIFQYMRFNWRKTPPNRQNTPNFWHDISVRSVP